MSHRWSVALIVAMAGASAGCVQTSEVSGPMPTSPSPTSRPPGSPSASNTTRSGGRIASAEDAKPPRADGPCQPSQLTAKAGPIEAALGARHLRVTVTNTSRIPCVVDGFATFDLNSASDETVPHTPARMTNEQTPRRVHIAPSTQAYVDLSWRAGEVPADRVASIMRITVTEGSAPKFVELPPDAMALDISYSPDTDQRSTVKIGAWQTDTTRAPGSP